MRTDSPERIVRKRPLARGNLPLVASFGGAALIVTRNTAVSFFRSTWTPSRSAGRTLLGRRRLDPGRLTSSGRACASPTMTRDFDTVTEPSGQWVGYASRPIRTYE